MSERKRAFPVAVASAVALLAAAWGNTLHNAFHFDDSHVLVDNLYVRSLGNASKFFTDARTFSALPQNQTYRPLVSLSLALDYALGGGLSPVAFHLDQILLLGLLGVALYFFYLRVMDRAEPSRVNRFAALFGATLFCVHTANTETMNLMHARSEILSALGIVCSFLVLWAAPRLRKLQIHLLPMVAGALAKTPAVLFAPLLFAWEFLQPAPPTEARPFATRLKAALRASLPAFAVGIGVFWFIEKYMAPPTQNYGGGNRLAYAQTQLFVWLHYLRLFVLPAGLSADTDLTLIPRWYDTRVLAGAAALLGLTWVAFRCARGPRAVRTWPVTFGLAWFAIGLLPASSVIPLAEPLNEHRVFLPFIGLVLATVWGTRLALEGRMRRSLPVIATACAILAALALGSFVRNRAWISAERLWEDVTVKSPGNGRGWMNYGTALMARGAYAEARDCYERAALLTPNYWTLETNRAIVEDALGSPTKAEEHFKRALELGPLQPDAHLFFARWLARTGRGPEAVAHLETALRLSPGGAVSRGLLTDLRAAQGDTAGAASLAREAVQAEPANARARAFAAGSLPDYGSSALVRRQSGILFGQQGDFVASALAYRSTLALDPSDADALNNLGWTLGKLGFFREAAIPLERAIALRPDFTLARNNLAWVKTNSQ